MSLKKPKVEAIELAIAKATSRLWADPEEELQLTDEQQRFWDEQCVAPEVDFEAELEKATPEEREAVRKVEKMFEPLQKIVAEMPKLTENDIQALYIAAYTGREPDEIPEAERKAAQDFWNTHPEAVADVVSCQFADIDKPKIRQWIEQASRPEEQAFLTYLDFFGANLLKAYKAFDNDGRAIVAEALGRGYTVYSKAYAKAALLPKFTASIIPQLSEDQKRIFANAVLHYREPPEDAEQAALFTLYVMLYDMADDDTKASAAAAIGLTKDDFSQYFYLAGGAKDKAVFPPDETTGKDRQESKTPKPTATTPKVKTKLPQLPPQRYGTGYYPLTLAFLNKSLLGIPLDGQYHTIGRGDYQFRVRLTVEKYTDFLPLPLDDLAEKISTIIAVGREEGAEYFDVNAIARYIQYGDPDFHTEETRKGGKHAGESKTVLGYISKEMADTVDKMIDFMTGIKADIEYPKWEKDKNGKKSLVKLKVSRPLLNGGVRVEISNYGHTTNTYGRGEAKVKQSLRVWGFPSSREDSELKNYVPVLYYIAQQLEQIAQIPQAEADIRRYLPEGKRITLEDVSLRDAALRRYFEIQRNGGNGAISLPKIEEETQLPQDQSKTQHYRIRKQRQKRLKAIVDTLMRDGKVRTAEAAPDGESIKIQTEEYRPKRGGAKKRKTPKKE